MTPLSQRRAVPAAAGNDLTARAVAERAVPRLADLSSPVEPIGPTTRCEVVSDRFSADSRLYGLPVVDENGRPIGLIHRFRFLERVAARFGRALTDMRPASSVMDRSPLLLDADTPIDKVNDLFVAGDNPFVFDGFILTTDGQYTAFVTGYDVARALTERRHAELSRLAEHDILTGLPNRDRFERRLHQFVTSDESAGTCVGLLFIDLDRFKHINDTYGHRVGDLLLCAIAQRLRANARPDDLVVRLSGDEFAIVMPDLRDPGESETVAAGILKHCLDPIDLDGHEVVVSCSIGIALYPEDASSADGLARAADAAVYHAKQVRNVYQRFRHEMSRSNTSPALNIGSLRQALEGEELTLNYQPLVDLASMTITGVEALVRWRHRNGEMIPADELVRLAEDSGLIIPLSEYVARRAMHDLLAWSAQSGHDNLHMSINISAVHLREERLAPMLDRLTAECGLHPHRLTLELTESAAMRAGSAAHTTLSDLKARGYSLAIDDFGTGYSSLGQLERLPVDILKIDQTFVSGIGQTGRSGAIARAIIALGRSLGMQLVAEGVETEAQLAFLREQRCDVAQGFLLGHPAPAADILAMIVDAGEGALRAQPPEARPRPRLALAPRG